MKKVMLLCAVIGSAVLSQAALVDDFESYATGNLGNVASPPWTSVLNPTSANVLIGEEVDGNGYLSYFAATTTVVRGGSRGITAIDNASTASTFFLRFFTETDTFNHSFGLSANAAPTAFTDMNVMMRVNAGVFDVRDGAGFTTGVAIQSGSWYNVWAVINQTQDTFDVYLTPGSAGEATVSDRVATGAAFRVGTTSSLVSFVALVQGFTGAPSANKVRLDDLYQFDGEMLLNPVPEPTTATMMILGLGYLFFRKKK